MTLRGEICHLAGRSEMDTGGVLFWLVLILVILGILYLLRGLIR